MEPPIWILYLKSLEEGRDAVPENLLREALAPGETQDESVSGIGNIKQFLQRHWAQFVDLLYGGEEERETATGYQTLVELREELQLRLDGLTKRIAVTEDRTDYVALVFEKLVTELVEEVKGHPRWNLALRVAQYEPKDIRAWRLTGKTVEDVFGEVSEEKIPADLLGGKSSLHSTQVDISDDELRGEGIDPQNLRSTRVALGEGVEHEETFRDDLIPSRPPLDPEYREDATWGEVLTELTNTYEVLTDQRSAAWRARELLDFRLAVLDNVLYRYDLFGRVEKLTDEDILQFVDEDKLEAAGAVVQASNDSDVGWGRRGILKRAATYCDDDTAKTYRAVQRTLGDLYPGQGRRGNPGEGKKEDLGRLLVERCKRYIDAFT